jgi:hypothetical protein
MKYAIKLANKHTIHWTRALFGAIF